MHTIGCAHLLRETSMSSIPRHLAAMFLLASAACAKGGDSSPASDTSALSAPPPPPAAAPASPADWKVSELGIGPLHAGMTVAEAAAAVPGEFTVAAGDSASECTYASWSAAPAGVHVMLSSGVVARIDVDSQSVRTEDGAGVGSSEASVDSLYRGRVRRMPHKYTPGASYLVVVAPADTMNRIVFETDGKVVTTYRAGRSPQVEFVERCG